MTITPNKTETNFILSKCKVTPLKRLNVLKLERDAAIIGIRLLKTVQKKTALRIHDTHFGQTVEWFLIGLLLRRKRNCLSPAGYEKNTNLQNPVNGVIYQQNKILQSIEHLA